MKKSIIRFAALAALTAAALCAQDPRGHGAGGPRGGGAGPGGVNSTTTPAQVTTIVAHQVTFLTTLLTLTTSQASQATALFTNELNSSITLDAQIVTAQTALGAAVKANDTAAITTQ